MRERLDRLNLWQRLGVVITIAWLLLAPLHPAVKHNGFDDEFLYFWVVGFFAYAIMAAIVWLAIFATVYAVRWI